MFSKLHKYAVWFSRFRGGCKVRVSGCSGFDSDGHVIIIIYAYLISTTLPLPRRRTAALRGWVCARSRGANLIPRLEACLRAVW